MKSRIIKMIRGQAEDIGDDSSMSATTDVTQLSEKTGSKSAQTPIIVKGLESFNLCDIIGQGGFGKVLLATHSACKQPLAVKVVKKRTLLWSGKDDVLNEKEVLKMTSKNPFFTRAYVTFQTEYYVFYVMEYLSGGDLRGLLNVNAPFPIPVTRIIAAEIICGLQFLKKKGIIHRDIKPENILLDNNGHAKIADFGVSVMNIFRDKKITGRVGTLEYMAPEMLLGKPYNQSVDWFSAGVIFYEMGTGKYPFSGRKTKEKLCYSLLKKDPSYPRSLNPHLRYFIKGLLNKRPDRRQLVVNNIRDYLFFHNFNWTCLEKDRVRPPISPQPLPPKTSKQMVNVVSSTEVKKLPLTENEKNYFRGFTFANDGWKVIKPTEQETEVHITCGKLVKEAFHTIWRKIKCW